MTVSPSDSLPSIRGFSNAGADLLCGLARWDLWGRLGWLEIKRRYHRTVIGPFWSALSLGLFVAALGSVGAGLWNQSLGTYLPFLVAGLVVWLMLSTIIIESTTLFIASATLFRNIRFDYSILAYALVWRNLIVFLHNLSIYILIHLFFAPARLIDPHLLLLVPGLFIIALNGVWVALLLGMFCLRFRDVQQLTTSLVQITMFVTPLFWPPDSLAGPERVIFVTLNPFYHLIEIVRAPLLGALPTFENYAAALLITASGWCLMYASFRYFRKRIPYWS